MLQGCNKSCMLNAVAFSIQHKLLQQLVVCAAIVIKVFKELYTECCSIQHLLYQVYYTSQKITAAQNELTLSYHTVRGLYFLAETIKASIINEYLPAITVGTTEVRAKEKTTITCTVSGIQTAPQSLKWQIDNQSYDDTSSSDDYQVIISL